MNFKVYHLFWNLEQLKENFPIQGQNGKKNGCFPMRDLEAEDLS